MSPPAHKPLRLLTIVMRGVQSKDKQDFLNTYLKQMTQYKLLVCGLFKTNRKDYKPMETSIVNGKNGVKTGLSNNSISKFCKLF